LEEEFAVEHHQGALQVVVELGNGLGEVITELMIVEHCSE
jgi:hypothetical protein